MEFPGDLHRLGHFLVDFVQHGLTWGELEGSDAFTNQSEPHPILLDPIGCKPLSGQGLVHNQTRPSIRPLRPAKLSVFIMFQKEPELTTHLSQTVRKNQTAGKFNSIIQGGGHSVD